MNIQKQIDLENDLVLQGIRNYYQHLRKAKEQLRETDTQYGQRLLTGLLEPVILGLKEFIRTDTASRNGKYKTLLMEVSPEVAAYIGLKCVLQTLHTGKTVNTVSLEIGKLIEDEIRYKIFKKEHKDFYKYTLQSFKKKNTKSYRHMRSALGVMSTKKGLRWNAWPQEYRLRVGSLVLDTILTNLDILEVYKKPHKRGFMHSIKASQGLLDWLSNFNEVHEVLTPYNKPCVVPPLDWTNMFEGGYHTEEMQKRTPFIIGLNKEHQDFVKEFPLDTVFNCVNTLQKVAWEVNIEILEIIKQVWDKGIEAGLPKQEPMDTPVFHDPRPYSEMDDLTKVEFKEWKQKVAALYTEETARVSKAYSVVRIISMADSYKDNPFYFVYRADFRGRLYANSAGLNPQGADFNKALLRFKNSEKLGVRGLYWLSVHGANCYGVDKVSFDDRVQWVKDNLNMFLSIADDPIGKSDLWANADKPFQFLAFVLEYVKAYKDPDNFCTHLPIGMDGSCNGIQHMSAMLRDTVGAASTNLIDGDKPNDIYKDVANRNAELIKEQPYSEYQAKWLAFMDKHNGLPRALVKRSVMTLPYGCTKFSVFQFLYDAIYKLDKDFFEDINEDCDYNREILWQAIQDVVISARKITDWLQKIARTLGKQELAVWWVNPVGFPVYQKFLKKQGKRIKTCLFGGTQMTHNYDTKLIDVQKQIQGIVPNLIHSNDAAHLVRTVNKSCSEGISDIVTVHDDFAVHANRIDLFRDIIRNEFASMYKENDPLKQLHDLCLNYKDFISVPELLEKGDLDIDEVRKSTYFFS